MLASQVISSVRFALNDASATRWSDPALIAYLNDGYQETILMRPDFRLNVSGGLNTPAQVVSLVSSLMLPDAYAGAMADYVIFRALSEDNSDGANPQKAQAHYQKFRTMLGA